MGKIIGVVLAGGKSERMGRDKKRLSLPFQPEEDFLGHAWRLVNSVVRPCFVSCAFNLPESGYPCVLDNVNAAGPMGGIIASLRLAVENGHEGVLALACDMPLLTADRLRQLLASHAERGESLATVFKNAASGRLEMLAAVYSATALPLLEEAMEHGRYSLCRALPREKLRLLPYGEKDEPYFLNCNTEGDLKRLRPPEIF